MIENDEFIRYLMERPDKAWELFKILFIEPWKNLPHELFHYEAHEKRALLAALSMLAGFAVFCFIGRTFLW